jgi:hypothetical protein
MTRATHWRLAAALVAACLLAATGQPARAESFAEGERAYLQQDYKRSLRLLTQLAQQGHPKAQYLLGRQHQFGQGTTRNYVLAYYWYSRAEKKGHVEAGLFRHLLVSKRGMTEAQVAEAKKLLGKGGKSTLAAARKNIPAAGRTPAKPEKRPTRGVPAKKPVPVNAVAGKKAPPSNKPTARKLARTPVKAPPTARHVPGKARKPAPYATAVVPRHDLRPRSGWTNPDIYRRPRCASCQNDADPDADPGWRNRAQPRPWADRAPDWRHPRYRRYGPGRRFHVPRYVYRLPPWQRRQWLRQHRWRVMNDPFYRRAWRAYMRYQHQQRHW